MSRRTQSPDPPGYDASVDNSRGSETPSLTDWADNYQAMRDEYVDRLHSDEQDDRRGTLSSPNDTSPKSRRKSKKKKKKTAASSSCPDVPSGSIDNPIDAANYQTNYQSMRDQYADLLYSNTGSHASSTKEPKKDSGSRAYPTNERNKDPPSPPSSPTSVDTGPKTHNYRGFSTSIGDMFAHPHHERVDCCAMTCCGIFQSDRDRYLLQGVTPPSPWKRVWVHFCLPLILFFMAGYVALHVPDKIMNEFLVLAFLLMLLGGIIQQCQKGRVKRMEIRKDVLWYKYQLLKHRNDMSLDQILDQHRSPEVEGDTNYYRGQTERDIGCSHPYCFLIGCYANDRPSMAAAMAADDNPIEESLCSCIFKFFCRPCCGQYVQLGGVCGMAQESREIEATLLPPAYRRLDYITMQPMIAFFEGIYNDRWRQFNTLNTSGPDGPKAVGPLQALLKQLQWPHLSQLSKTLLLGWVALTAFLGVWSVVGPLFWTQFLQGEGRRHYFSVGDYVVYLISWFVCFATLALVVYLCERRRPLELSVDAMVKYFACGFVLSTTLSMFYEIVLGMVLRLVMMVLMTLTGVQVVEDRGYESWVQEPLMSMGFGGKRSANHYTLAAAGGEDYLPVFGRDHPFVFSIYLFVNAYFLAAMVEELCKYFGYRMMEHPDFLSRSDLEDAAQAGVVSGEEGEAKEAKGPQRVSFPHHGESLEAQGAAVTVAMVCVALGVSCCEDLVFVFFYYGSSVQMELYVLIARTLFPIHPIAAALQSIGVCERDVEKSPARIGRILLPAVLFHGTYDFLLLWIDFLASLKRSDGYDNVNSDEALEIGTNAVLASYVTSAAIMGGALYWFYRESKKQRERLAARDQNPSIFSAMT